ncbi:MAG: hypothetical protein ABIQ77_01015, partial [Anaerolineales bacterium]
MATFDLNILPIHRINNQELDSLPGLLAVTPPRKTARGREKDNLIVYLMLSGNAPLSNAELKDLNNKASGLFYQSAGPLTSAMRKVTESINTVLLERNRSTTGRGQYALALLVLAVVRESHCTLLLSGPTHAVWVSEGQSRHIHDAALSGKGLGSGQSIQTYFSQVELHPQDLLVLCGKFPRDWEADLLNERPPASLNACYRKLTFTKGDLHAALIQAQNGNGTLTILRPDLNESRPIPTPPLPVSTVKESVSPEETPSAQSLISNSPVSAISEAELDELADFAAHMIQPSAYVMPPLPEDMIPLPEEEIPARESAMRGFPTSLPRTKLSGPKVDLVEATDEEDESDSAPARAGGPSAHAEAARQMAKTMAGGIQSGRRMNERAGTFLQKFIPRLLPNANSKKPLVIPTYVMIFIAVVIPAVVVTMASVIYLRFGQSIQYDELYRQALAARAQADGATEPIRQRDGWQSVLLLLDSADEYRQTDESKLLRSEAQVKLDTLMGVVRLEFNPAFTSGIGGSTQISRMAASESDLYMLDAERGNILHAAFTGQSLELDSTFSCQSGTYAGYQVDTMVDLLALPKVNTVGATVLGIDPKGNLLYCSPGQVPQAIPLPALPNTNWGRITAFALDNGSLYVLDAT